MHYNGFRYYSTTIGRYMSSDPIGLTGGMNPYGYAADNPLMYYDSPSLYCLDADEIKNYFASIDEGTKGLRIATIIGISPAGPVVGIAAGVFLIPFLAIGRYQTSQSAQRGEALGIFFSIMLLTPKSTKDVAVSSAKGLVSPEVANSLQDGGMTEFGANMVAGGVVGGLASKILSKSVLADAAIAAGVSVVSDVVKFAVLQGNECECIK
ncbi:MAG: RHS repeat-associated core domain-containing protein [Proteobacteria bacterium]|nr:RHS repeat-associated core domain-containing protein [Pseudomonadota bacterium]